MCDEILPSAAILGLLPAGMWWEANQPLPSLIPSHTVMTQLTKYSPNTLISRLPNTWFLQDHEKWKGYIRQKYCSIIRCKKGQASWTRLCYFPPSCAILNPFQDGNSETYMGDTWHPATLFLYICETVDTQSYASLKLRLNDRPTDRCSM